MKPQVHEYQKYKTYRVFGDKSKLPERLQRTDLQQNDSFVMVSSMGYVFSPDLSDQYFDYNDYGDVNPTFLQLSDGDLEKYFVPCNVTTEYKGHTFEWRQLNDQMIFHGGHWEMSQKLKTNLMFGHRIVLETVLNAYTKMYSELVAKNV